MTPYPPKKIPTDAEKTAMLAQSRTLQQGLEYGTMLREVMDLHSLAGDVLGRAKDEARRRYWSDVDFYARVNAARAVFTYSRHDVSMDVLQAAIHVALDPATPKEDAPDD